MTTIVGQQEPKGLAQPDVANVAGHLASSILAGAQFESLSVRHTSLRRWVC